MNIAWVTFREMPDGIDDELPAIRVLRERGHDVATVVWNVPETRSYDAWLIRTPWDYHLASTEFFDWLDGLEASGQCVINPLRMMRWNIDKSYLIELGDRGISIPVTRLARPGAKFDVQQVMQHSVGVVLKPVIGANAEDTWRIDDVPAAQRRLDEMLRRYPVIVQAFLPEIQTEGEWSLMYFNAEYSHAALKKPATGDFRVQHERGGRVEQATAPQDLVEFGRSVLACLDEMPLYARIDCVERPDGPCLMELELVEPDLFFRCDDSAAVRFADAFERYVK